MKSSIGALIALFIVVACDDIIEVTDISNSSVNILAPINGVVLDTTQVNFSWEALKDAEAYQVQVATPNFENAQQIVIDSILERTSLMTNLDYKAYEWRVRGLNSGYKTGYSSQNFSVEK